MAINLITSMLEPDRQMNLWLGKSLALPSSTQFATIPSKCNPCHTREEHSKLMALTVLRLNH